MALRSVPTAASASQRKSCHADLSLNDVFDVIRHSDPATFEEFQHHLSAAMSAPVASSAASSAASNVAKAKKAAFVRIVEQPASKGLRFRYECEGRSAGSIPGASTSEANKTYPTIQVVGYRGRAVVVVSCVTAEAPYRPHPHALVGKEGCKKGVCTVEIPTDAMTIAFQSLGIQCVKKKDIEEALALRQQIRVDPFQTGFSHAECPQGLDLNCVRLCFQVFLEGSEKGAFTFALKPVVSEPIYDKKAKNDLTICRLTECSASVAGGKEVLLFCDKVVKDDIQVRFFQEDDSTNVVWEALADFQPSDVHKQYGIAFRTPRYKTIEVDSTVSAFIQLRRPSDGATSEPRRFDFLPLDAGRGFWAAKRLKTNYSVFNRILAVDQAEAAGAAGGEANDELRRKLRPQQQTPQPEPQLQQQATDPTEEIRRKFRQQQQELQQQQLQQLQQQQLLQQQQQLQQLQAQQQLLLQQQQPSLPVQPSPSVTGMRPPAALPQATGHNNMFAQLSVGGVMVLDRPLSLVSEASLATTATADTVVSRHSVNELLSMAAEDMSVYSVDLGEALDGGDSALHTLIKMEQDLAATDDNRASVISVASTVKEVKPSLATPDANGNDAMDVDVHALYDDVMQVVYDDVDVKYDSVDLVPPPPVRRRNLSVDLGRVTPAAEPDKPLPVTPSRMPHIISKLTRKKSESDLQVELKKAKAREEELKRAKAREEEEARKAKAKEEEELKKAKAREEKQRKTEEAKRKKAPDSLAVDNSGGKQTLFQRLFQRTKSQQDELPSPDANANANAVVASVMAGNATAGAQSAPPVPSHKAAVHDSNSNASPSIGAALNDNSLDSMNGNDAGEPTEADLNDLQQFLDSGNLDHLDNMVTEFARQYMPELVNGSPGKPDAAGKA